MLIHEVNFNIPVNVLNFLNHANPPLIVIHTGDIGEACKIVYVVR